MTASDEDGPRRDPPSARNVEGRGGEPPDPVTFQLFNEIGIISQLSANAFTRVLPPGLSLAQFSVLNNFVKLGGDRTPLQLARAFQVTKGAMTNTLQRLEAQGYIAVAPDPKDGRGKRVTITQAGRDARDAAIARLVPMIEALELEVPVSDIAAALPFLRRLRSVLDSDAFRQMTPDKSDDRD